MKSEHREEERWHLGHLIQGLERGEHVTFTRSSYHRLSQGIEVHVRRFDNWARPFVLEVGDALGHNHFDSPELNRAMALVRKVHAALTSLREHDYGTATAATPTVQPACRIGKYGRTGTGFPGTGEAG